MKLYTKTGDKGLTSLYDGTRLPKNDSVFESLGNLDELNANIGMVKAFWKDVCPSPMKPHNHFGLYDCITLDDKLTTIQKNIMNICSVIAMNGSGDVSIIHDIENDIDRLSSLVPELKNFIIPSGNKTCASIHVCRAITRRTERSCQEECENVRVYLNRLSDYFFVLSRFIAMSLGITEELN